LETVTSGLAKPYAIQLSPSSIDASKQNEGLLEGSIAINQSLSSSEGFFRPEEKA
jgi:hypothetical protein